MNYYDGIMVVIGNEVMGPKWTAGKTTQQIYVAVKDSKAESVKGDNGGLTKFGISQKAYPNEDIKNLTIERAISLYKKDYWDKVRGDSLPYNIAYALFNYGVNRGVSTAVRYAQEVVGATQDGVMGPKTVSAILAKGATQFLSEFLTLAKQGYATIVANNPSQSKFLDGWNNRLDEIANYVGVKPVTLVASTGFLLVTGFFLLIFLSLPKTRTA
jgi:hypothetical protein